MVVKPFRLANLKKVSSADQRLLDFVCELLPATRARDVLAVEIRKTLIKHLGEKSFYYLDSVQTKPYAGFLRELPDMALIVIIGMEPVSQKFILHIDSNLAFLLIDRLLGGDGQMASLNRMLTETEQGVVQYLIMQVLAQVWQTCGRSARVHFRFERFCTSVRDIEKLGSDKDTAVMLAFKVGIGEQSGFVKLVFNGEFIEKAASILPAPAVEDRYLIDKMKHHDFIKATLWAEAGRATVPPEDLEALEAGDVMLFDETSVALTDGKIAGEVELRVGLGESGAVKANVSSHGNIIKCTIVG